MRSLLVKTLLISLLEMLICTPGPPPSSEALLKKLSREGERCMEEEIKRALFGVKQVKETMEKRKEKHSRLMDGLRYSSDKKKGALQLARETEQKLEVAEQQCQDALKASFEGCRPCLEDACKTFYTSTCRRGFSSFSFKVEELFRRMSSQLESPDQVYNQNEGNPDPSNSVEDQRLAGGLEDPEVLRAESSFSQLHGNVSLLYNGSTDLVRRMQEVFGHAFLQAYTTELKPMSLVPMQEASGVGFLRAVGLDHVLDSVYEFGKTVWEEVSSTVTDVFEETRDAEEDSQQSNDGGSLPNSGQSQSRHLCRQLRRQPSECWHLQNHCETCEAHLLQECPAMRQLHSELVEIHLLLNASLQQYRDRLELVQTHTADTQSWLQVMADEYNWVSRLSNSTLGPEHVFHVTEVTALQQDRDSTSKVDTGVVVNILDSPHLSLSVPAELALDDPAFIQYVTQEALALHKQRIRGME